MSDRLELLEERDTAAKNYFVLLRVIDILRGIRRAYSHNGAGMIAAEDGEAIFDGAEDDLRVLGRLAEAEHMKLDSATRRLAGVALPGEDGGGA